MLGARRRHVRFLAHKAGIHGGIHRTVAEGSGLGTYHDVTILHITAQSIYSTVPLKYVLGVLCMLNTVAKESLFPSSRTSMLSRMVQT